MKGQANIEIMPPDPLATVGTKRIELLRNGLRMMALRALADADLADDVAQEALLRALRAVTPDIAADDQRLGAFVGGIARHVIADFHRSTRRTLQLSAATIYPIADSDALAGMVAAEELHRIRCAITRLSANDQIIIRASFFEGLTPTEIADRVAEPVERVRKRKSRALARLRGELEPEASHGTPSQATIDERPGPEAIAQGGV